MNTKIKLMRFKTIVGFENGVNEFIKTLGPDNFIKLDFIPKTTADYYIAIVTYFA